MATLPDMSKPLPLQTRFGPCPPAAGVCPFKGCPVHDDMMCAGQGNCYDEQCYCAVDAAGTDCSLPLCERRQDCANGQFCNNVGECEWGTEPPPAPPYDLVVCLFHE